MNDNEYECPYRLVVANNRDEFWDRPTATAEFRGDNQKWIGGFYLFIKKGAYIRRANLQYIFNCASENSLNIVFCF